MSAKFRSNTRSSYRHNGLGQPDSRLTMHPLYEGLGRDEKERQVCYRALFRSELDQAALDDIRLAINQNQPMGNARFLKKIEAMTGVRRQARPRGRPRLESDAAPECVPESQQKLRLQKSRRWPLSFRLCLCVPILTKIRGCENQQIR